MEVKKRCWVRFFLLPSPVPLLPPVLPDSRPPVPPPYIITSSRPVRRNFEARVFQRVLSRNCPRTDMNWGLHTEYTLQHGGRYKSYYFVEKSKSYKISPLNAFPLKFRVQDNFLCAPWIFGISKIPTHCLKEALVIWPLSASGLLHYYIFTSLFLNIEGLFGEIRKTGANFN